jgi:hypothetical protein
MMFADPIEAAPNMDLLGNTNLSRGVAAILTQHRAPAASRANLLSSSPASRANPYLQRDDFQLPNAVPNRPRSEFSESLLGAVDESFTVLGDPTFHTALKDLRQSS